MKDAPVAKSDNRPGNEAGNENQDPPIKKGKNGKNQGNMRENLIYVLVDLFCFGRGFILKA